MTFYVLALRIGKAGMAVYAIIGGFVHFIHYATSGHTYPIVWLVLGIPFCFFFVIYLMCRLLGIRDPGEVVDEVVDVGVESNSNEAGEDRKASER
jgi:hypothetical protein